MDNFSFNEVPADPEQALVVGRLKQRFVDAGTLTSQLLVECLESVTQSIGGVTWAAVVGANGGRTVPRGETEMKKNVKF